MGEWMNERKPMLEFLVENFPFFAVHMSHSTLIPWLKQEMLVRYRPFVNIIFRILFINGRRKHIKSFTKDPNFFTKM